MVVVVEDGVDVFKTITIRFTGVISGVVTLVVTEGPPVDTVDCSSSFFASTLVAKIVFTISVFMVKDATEFVLKTVVFASVWFAIASVCHATTSVKSVLDIFTFISVWASN